LKKKRKEKKESLKIMNSASLNLTFTKMTSR